MKRIAVIVALALLVSIIPLPALAEAELIYRTEDVELHLPASWTDRVLILPASDGVTFYQKASYDKYMEEGIPGGGYLFTLGGCVNSDFKDLPSFIYLGFCEDSAMNYYMELPTDYPAYMDDEIRAEWDSMHDMMRGIAQGAVIRGSAMDPAGRQNTGVSTGENQPAPDGAGEIVLEIINSPATLDGVTVALERATAVKSQDPEGFTYAFAGTLENNSDEGIMKVIYTFSLIDVNGEAFRSFGEVYDGEEAALPPHAKIDFSLDDVKWGKQSVPAAVEIGVSSVQTEAELPPAHIPQRGEYLYQALGDEKLANIREEKPATLSFHVDQGGYGRTAVFDAGDALDRAVELLCAIQIGEETGEFVTDNYNWIQLTWEDGSHTGISLNLSNLEYYVHSNPHSYALENLDAFWSFCDDYLKEDQ